MPSYIGQTGPVKDMIHGVNYASAGAGIIFSSGSELVGFSLCVIRLAFTYLFSEKLALRVGIVALKQISQTLLIFLFDFDRERQLSEACHV